MSISTLKWRQQKTLKDCEHRCTHWKIAEDKPQYRVNWRYRHQRWQKNLKDCEHHCTLRQMTDDKPQWDKFNWRYKPPYMKGRWEGGTLKWRQQKTLKDCEHRCTHWKIAEDKPQYRVNWRYRHQRWQKNLKDCEHHCTLRQMTDDKPQWDKFNWRYKPPYMKDHSLPF